jgi:DNA-binding response OmpR family regulator
MILIADDDHRVRSVLLHTLALGKLETKAVANGQQVLDAIEEQIPELLVMDVNMPVMNGIEVCRRLRTDERTVDLPIILLSGERSERVMLDGFEGGADDYVTKPFLPDVFLAKVKATLRARHKALGHVTVADLPPGTWIDDRFHLGARIGAGSMGVVYRARDSEQRVEVAIKIEHSPNREASARDPSRRFRREIEALSQIQHPNVVRMYQAGVFDDHLYYAMQFVDGPSLRARLEAQGALSVRESLRIAAEVAEGLCAVHAAGFVHRDVKPENILLDSKGGVRIGDFGVVFPLELDRTRLTVDGRIVGTLLYMSPEQLCTREVDHRSDLYSLGLVLFEMLTGKPVRTSSHPAGILIESGSLIPEPRELDPSIPAAVSELCVKIASPDRDERIQTAREARDWLRRAGESMQHPRTPQ